MHAHRERPKCTNACNSCRKRKVKCSGESRCSNCSDHGQECVYPKLLPRRRRIMEGAHTQSQVDPILSVTPANTNGFSENLRSVSQPEWTPSSDFTTSHIRQEKIGTELSEPHDADVRYQPSTALASMPTPATQVDAARIITTTSSNRTPEEDTRFDDLPNHYRPEEHQGDKEECIIAPQKINWEYHGPISWLSICSEPGIAWVAERTGVTDFARSARSLSLGWTQRLKLGNNMNRERASEVDSKTAWRFAKAYFEECYDSIFGLVYRPAFEARLRRHFEESFPDDSAWYAIRHVVYASGCRILLSKDPSTTFVEAQQQAWKYFENALSVHTELLCSPSGLPAVQALALMSYYVEGLGSPALEYTFCAGAVRLAQGKGLHRQPARGWNLPESEVLHRNWLWWAIYCCDKLIAKRSGRPSAIDDDDISCQIPTKKVNGSSVDVEIFTCIIKHAQSSGQICRGLSSVKALQSTPAKLIETIADLEKKLQDWFRLVPPHLKMKVSRNFAPPPATRFIYLMYLHNAYYGSLMAIHTIFSYPWISAFFGTVKSPDFRNQVLLSTNILAESARNIILTTRHIVIDGASPHWLAFSYPMFRLINLFICVLRNPTSPSSFSDLALMDMVAGHFAHMEFATSSEMSFPFTRELAALARQTVMSTLEKDSVDSETILVPLSDVSRDMSINPFENLNDFSMGSLDMEGWNIFSSFGVERGIPDWGYVFQGE